MWTTPEKHTMNRETLRNDQPEQNHKKSWVQDGGWHPPTPPPTKEAFRIKGTWWNTEQNKNTNNNSQTEDSQRKSPTMNQSNWKGTSQKPHWQEQSLHNAKRTKPLRRRVLIEEGLAKSSQKQHSENTDKWHLCKAGSFSYGESPRAPPLEGTSLHRWNNSVERPWGILSLFTTCLPLCVKSHCRRLWMWHVDYPRKAHYKERSKHYEMINQNKTTRRAGYKTVYDTPHPHRPPPPPPKEAFRIKGTWWNTEESNNTNNNSQIEDSQRKSPTMNQSNWKGTSQKPHWQEQSLHNAKTTKPLRRRVLTEELES